MSKIKNGRLDQYGAEPFEQQQLGTAGVEGVNATCALLAMTQARNRDRYVHAIVIISVDSGGAMGQSSHSQKCRRGAARGLFAPTPLVAPQHKSFGQSREYQMPHRRFINR